MTPLEIGTFMITAISLIGNVATVYVSMTVKLEVSKLRGEMHEKFISKNDHNLLMKVNGK